MKKQEVVNDIFSVLKIVFVFAISVTTFVTIIYFLCFKWPEEETFNFEDKAMTEMFFQRNQQIIDKYGIDYIKRDSAVSRGFSTEYKLSTKEKFNLKKVGIPNSDRYSSYLDCLVPIYILMDNETKTLKFNSGDIRTFNKNDLFYLTEKCLKETVVGIEKYIAEEKRFTEEFKLKEEK